MDREHLSSLQHVYHVRKIVGVTTQKKVMRVIVLTGPPGAGKNTIAQIIAKQKNQCAVIDVDLVRWMILQPHKAPWEGEAGKKQQLLGVQNTCLVANNFLKEGYEVIILDVLTTDTAKLYRKQLQKSNVKILLLLPTYEEILRRNIIRPPRLKEGEVKMLYDQQRAFTGYDEIIDNTHLFPEDTAQKLLQHFSI